MGDFPEAQPQGEVAVHQREESEGARAFSEWQLSSADTSSSKG